MATITGNGTLYDADDNELGAVAYRIEHDGGPGEPIVVWSGELNLEPETADVPLEPGRYILETDDGTRGEIELSPTGAASGAIGQVAFTGAGLLGGQPTAGV